MFRQTFVRAFLKLTIVRCLLNEVENGLSERLVGYRPSYGNVSHAALLTLHQASSPAEFCSDMASRFVGEGFTAFAMARPLRGCVCHLENNTNFDVVILVWRIT